MGTPVVFVTGWNPTHGKGGGSAYVRAHMRAAMRAGYEPHVFCLDAGSGTREESFGAIHRVVPAPPFRRPQPRGIGPGQPRTEQPFAE